MRAPLVLLPLLAACAAAPEAPPPRPERFEGPGERLLLILETAPGSRLSGGHAWLSAPDAPEIAWVAFQVGQDLALRPGFAGEAHLLSEPLDAARAEAVRRPEQPAWRCRFELTFAQGGLLLREDGLPRMAIATWTTDADGRGAVIGAPYELLRTR